MTTPSPSESSDCRWADRQTFDRICLDDVEAVIELLVGQCGRGLKYLERQFEYPDLLGDLYLHLKEDGWRRLRTWLRQSSLRHWTHQVAVRLCLAKVRADKRRFRGFAEWNLNYLPNQPVPLAGPPEVYGQGELLLAIQNLASEKERLLILSHCIEGRPIEEVATELGINVNYAYVIKSRAIAHLREALVRRLADV